MYMREPAAGAPVAVPMRSGYVAAALHRQRHPRPRPRPHAHAVPRPRHRRRHVRHGLTIGCTRPASTPRPRLHRARSRGPDPCFGAGSRTRRRPPMRLVRVRTAAVCLRQCRPPQNKDRVPDSGRSWRAMDQGVSLTDPPDDATRRPVTLTDPSDHATRRPVTLADLSDHATRRPVTLTDPSDHATRRPVTLADPSDHATRRPVTLTDPSDHATRRPVTLADPSDHATRRPVTLTDPSDHATRRPVTLTDPSDDATRPTVTLTDPSGHATRPTVSPEQHPESGARSLFWGGRHCLRQTAAVRTRTSRMDGRLRVREPAPKQGSGTRLRVRCRRWDAVDDGTL